MRDRKRVFISAETPEEEEALAVSEKEWDDSRIELLTEEVTIHLQPFVLQKYEEFKNTRRLDLVSIEELVNALLREYFYDRGF